MQVQGFEFREFLRTFVTQKVCLWFCDACRLMVAKIHCRFSYRAYHFPTVDDINPALP